MSQSQRTLRIDFKKCIKAGECYYNHPDLFKAADSAYPMLIVAHPSTEREVREAREAIDVCPSGAITFEDD